MSKIRPSRLLHFLFIFILSFTLVGLVSCSVIKPIPVETQIHVVDSTVYHMVDSVVYIPKEVIKDVVPIYDTLYMETSMAKAEAYVDTVTHNLKGKLENKKGVEYKYIYKDKIQYRDSIITKEVPVPVEIEKIKHKHYFYEPILWLITLLSIGYVGIKYIKKRYGFGFFSR